MRTDVRPVLESIQAPTLVLHRRGDRHVSDGHAQYLAERIPQARLVEFDGDDHEWFAGDSDRVLDEIESFLTGARARPADQSRAVDRVVHRHRRIDRTRSGFGRRGLDDGAGRPQPRRRAARGRRARERSSSSPATARSRPSRPGASDQLRVRDSRRGGRPRPRHPHRPAYRRGGDGGRRCAWHRGPHRCAHHGARGARRGTRVGRDPTAGARVQDRVRRPRQPRIEGRAGSVAGPCGCPPCEPARSSRSPSSTA